AEALEPPAHRRRGTAGEDRAGADRGERRLVELAVAVVGGEGNQLEVTGLHGRGGTEQRPDLLDELLVLAPGPLENIRHTGILPHFLCPLIQMSEIQGTDA